MRMKNFVKVFLFSLIVALSMNALDMFFHYSTNTAVHIGYVTVKLTIIFLSIFLISQFISISNRDGIVVSIFGPFIFWLYYIYAYPTLDRAVFRLDEQFYFIFPHIVMMFVAYFSLYWFIIKENFKKIYFLISSTLTLLALNLLYFMLKFKIKGIPDSDAANMVVFIDATKMLLISLIAVAIVLFIYKNKFKGLIAGLISAIASYFLLSNLSSGLLHSIYAFLIVNLVFYIIEVLGGYNA
ncbi:hypothetical protein HY498_00505 [Candidatus Woesearchaeota archaeon]|nr:hypothetical protein [Candidatus Woesearchaeota archaeon]